MGAAKTVISKDWLTQKDKRSDRTRKIHKFEQMRVTRSEDLPELMTTKEAAEVLSCHYKTVEEFRKDGSLKFIKLRGRYFTTPEYIADYIESESKKK